jgi:hypothetical protein
MGLKTKIRNALKRPNKKEQAILRHEDAAAQFLEIGVTAELIVDKINAFDWLDLGEAKSEEQLSSIIFKFFEGFKFEYPPRYEAIILKAFTHKFMGALDYLREAINEVHASYNVEGTSKGFRNATVDKFYYINYWADKKSIPVNYNERSQNNRALFNLDTIILSILADKLQVFNNYENNKPKKR